MTTTSDQHSTDDQESSSPPHLLFPDANQPADDNDAGDMVRRVQPSRRDSALRHAFRRELSRLATLLLKRELTYPEYLDAMVKLHRQCGRDGFSADQAAEELHAYHRRRANGRQWAARLSPQRTSRRSRLPTLSTDAA